MSDQDTRKLALRGYAKYVADAITDIQGTICHGPKAFESGSDERRQLYVIQGALMGILSEASSIIRTLGNDYQKGLDRRMYNYRRSDEGKHAFVKLKSEVEKMVEILERPIKEESTNE